MNIRVVALVALALTSCTTLNERGTRVQVVTRSEVKDYQFVGTVTGSAPFGGLVRTISYEAALNELLNNAGALGASRVVLTEGQRGPRWWTFEQNLRADAYKAPDTAQVH